MTFNKKKTGFIIFLILVLFFFFSRTIYTYNMPEVTGARPRRGHLEKIEISTGIAGWAETESIYAVSGGTAGRVFVREGDFVEKGTVLFEMDFDIASARRRFSEAENNITKLEAEINALNSRLSGIREALAAESSEFETVDSGGLAGLIFLELKKALQAFKSAEFSFEIGTLSRNEFVNAENNYRAILLKYEAEADELALTLTLKRMENENLKLIKDSTAEILKDYLENTIVISPADGMISVLNVERGKYFLENSLLLTIGTGEEFTVECTISLDNNFVNPGDNCELSNSSHVLSGTVRRVRPSAQGKTVTISLMSGRVSEGETFEITFEKTSAADFILVPSAALNQDNDGYFLFRIKRRRGIMGDEFFLERLNVFAGDSDHQNTVIVRGITFFEPIVLVSNKVLSEGAVVTLKNPGDFFEN